MRVSTILAETDWRPLHRKCAETDPEGVRLTPKGLAVCSCGVTLGTPPEEYHVELSECGRSFVDPPFEPTEEPQHMGVVINGRDDDLAAAPGEVYHAGPPDPADGDLDLFSEAPGTVVAARGMVEPTSAVVPVDPIESEIIAIDPTKPYGPQDIELQLVSILSRLEGGQHFQRQWEVKASQAGIAYELAYAKAIRASDGRSKEIREADALVACEELYIAKADAEAIVKAVRESMHNLRSLLSGFQSVARSVGASFGSANFNNV